MRLSKLRTQYTHMRDERIMHPAVSIRTREEVGAYYGDLLETIDIAMAAITKVHKLTPPVMLIETKELARHADQR